MTSDTAEFEAVTAKRETPNALLVVIGGVSTWIPKSVIHDDSEVWREGDTGTLVLPEWFAVKARLV